VSPAEHNRAGDTVLLEDEDVTDDEILSAIVDGSKFTLEASGR
jgi:hypothetical protein